MESEGPREEDPEEENPEENDPAKEDPEKENPWGKDSEDDSKDGSSTVSNVILE